MKHFLSMKDISEKEIASLIRLGLKIKKRPAGFSNALERKTLLMLFEAPSLRTRLSFEAGMAQLGGHAIAYNLGESTVGKKESVEDFARVVSRYADIIVPRVYSHGMLLRISKNSGVPVINGMTNFEHPCQILSDLMTIFEKKKKLGGLKIAYVGDGYNNTTHSLLYGCSKVGMDVSVACPKKFMPDRKVIAESLRLARNHGSGVEITTDARKAVSGADIVYTDSWMSYHVPESREKARRKIFMPYQVNRNLMSRAPKALFMHCMPAKRGDEVTDDVMDSRQSIVYDQAENRLHAQKALLLRLLGKK